MKRYKKREVLKENPKKQPLPNIANPTREEFIPSCPMNDGSLGRKSNPYPQSKATAKVLRIVFSMLKRPVFVTADAIRE